MISNPRRPGARRGANALEFAMILPALLLMMFGLAEFSWLFNRYLMVSDAAQAAARLAAMTPEGDDAVGVAVTEARARLAPIEPQDVEVEVAVVGESPSRIITVTVTVPFITLTSYIPGVPDTLTATTSLRMEDSP